MLLAKNIYKTRRFVVILTTMKHTFLLFTTVKCYVSGRIELTQHFAVPLMSKSVNLSIWWHGSNMVLLTHCLPQWVALVTHYTCDAVTLLRLHRAIPSISSSTYICLMFWLTQFEQEHASTHNSPSSRQEHFLTSTHSLHLALSYVLANTPMESNGQYRWVRDRTSTGQMAECAW